MVIFSGLLLSVSGGENPGQVPLFDSVFHPTEVASIEVEHGRKWSAFLNRIYVSHSSSLFVRAVRICGVYEDSSRSTLFLTTEITSTGGVLFLTQV